jgi:Ca2+-transporting ATPase
MNIIMVGCQVVIIYFGSTAFSIVELNGNQWAISVVVALLCVPWGVCVRLFPDAWFGAIAKFVGVPFVAVYRPLARVTDRVSRKMESKKKSKETDEDASDESSCRGRGKSPVETIKVPGDAEKHVL